jgi:hypothetical protein
MRIEWTPPVRPSTQRRDDRGVATDRSFASVLGSDPAVTVATQAAQTLQTVAGLLSLQEVQDAATGRRRRAVARGEKLLDALDELRLGMLTGAMSREQMTLLARLAQEGAATVDDPHLAEILAEIELRAAVELAKLEVAQEA